VDFTSSNLIPAEQDGDCYNMPVEYDKLPESNRMERLKSEQETEKNILIQSMTTKLKFSEAKHNNIIQALRDLLDSPDEGQTDIKKVIELKLD
jgi:hypothetical protein